MKKYRIKIAPEALSDIREIKYWYDSQKIDLGKTFKDTVIKQINDLTENPQIFAIRYEEIRCMLVRKFPYTVHFISTKRFPLLKFWQLSALTEIPKSGKKKQIGFNTVTVYTGIFD